MSTSVMEATFFFLLVWVNYTQLFLLIEMYIYPFCTVIHLMN